MKNNLNKYDQKCNLYQLRVLNNNINIKLNYFNTLYYICNIVWNYFFRF